MKRSSIQLSVVLSLGLLAVVACTSTAGVPITLRLALEPLSDGRATTPSGWSVELTEARILLGPIYAYAPDDEPMAWRSPFAPSIARAHGGFDPLDGRLVRAEHLEQVAFDALAGPLEVGPIDGLLGAVDELSVVLDAPRDANAAPDGPTHGHHAWVRGLARRGDATVAFEGGLDLPDEGLLRRVDGVSVTGPPLGEGARLVLGIDPARWLSEADFEGLPAEGAVLDDRTQPHRAFRLGARGSRAYAARTEE